MQPATTPAARRRSTRFSTKRELGWLLTRRGAAECSVVAPSRRRGVAPPRRRAAVAQVSSATATAEHRRLASSQLVRGRRRSGAPPPQACSLGRSRPRETRATKNPRAFQHAGLFGPWPREPLACFFFAVVEDHHRRFVFGDTLIVDHDLGHILDARGVVHDLEHRTLENRT